MEESVRLDEAIKLTGFARNKVPRDAKEVANEEEETRQHLEFICREAFKNKAWLTIKGVNTCRHALDTSNIIYKGLQEDVEKADVSDLSTHFIKSLLSSLKPQKSGRQGRSEIRHRSH